MEAGPAGQVEEAGQAEEAGPAEEPEPEQVQAVGLALWWEVGSPLSLMVEEEEDRSEEEL